MRRMVHLSLFAVMIAAMVLFSGCGVTPPGSGSLESRSIRVELLKNGSLEGNGAGPDYWVWNPDEQTVDWSDAYYRSGAKSVGCENVVDSDSMASAYWSQTVWPPTGVKVKLTAWVRMRNLAGNGAALTIRGDETVSPEGVAEFISGTYPEISISGTTTGWVKYTLVEVIPANIKSLTVFLLILPDTTGTVYFDDISLTYQAKSPPTIGTELLADGSMESGDTSPDLWLQNAGEQNLVWSTEYFRSGARSMGCDNIVDSEWLAVWSQTVTPVPTGVRTRLTVWARMNNLAGGGAAIAIRGDDTETAEGASEFFATTEFVSPILGTTTDWAQYTLESAPIPAGIKSLTVFLLILPHTTGSIYFDDASLKSVSIPL